MVESFFFVSFMVLFVTSDVSWKLLPHPFTNLFVLTGLFFSISGAQNGFSHLFAVAADFILLGFILYGTAQMIPNGLGGGDVKMGAGLAPWLGFSKCIVALLLAFGCGALFTIPLLLAKKIKKKTMIPFGPFLAAGSLVLWFWPDFIKRMGIGL